MPDGEVGELDTPHGLARVHRYPNGAPVGSLVLGHGAGGGVQAPDLLAVRDAALGLGLTVVLVEQPYRVAGRRAPAPAGRLDEAWVAVLAELAWSAPLVVGGRSSGARVACRTAVAVGAAAVLCLAYPLVPPRAARPTSRRGELDGVALPTLVVQGARDPYGRPEARVGREVAVVRGDHGLDGDLPAVAQAVEGWLRAVLGLG